MLQGELVEIAPFPRSRWDGIDSRISAQSFQPVIGTTEIIVNNAHILTLMFYANTMYTISQVEIEMNFSTTQRALIF